MKRTFTLSICLILIFSLCSCSVQKSKRSFQAMDTFMSLSVYGGDDVSVKIEGIIKKLDSELSATDKNSEIYNLNHSGEKSLSANAADILRKTLPLCAETDGALDITVYPLVEEWGFISKDYKIPAQQRLDLLLKSVDFTKVKQSGNTVTLPGKVQIDLGAVAKGYAADKSVEILKQNDCPGAILNLGGTVTAFGSKEGGKSWRVGIADPKNSAAYMGFIECRDKIIATSGSYERFFEGDDGKIYNHIINPKTGIPVDNGIESVTVISESGIMSDAFSTALFVMGLDGAMSFQKSRGDFDCVILTDGGEAYVSNGISDSFAVADGYEYEVITF